MAIKSHSSHLKMTSRAGLVVSKLCSDKRLDASLDGSLDASEAAKQRMCVCGSWCEGVQLGPCSVGGDSSFLFSSLS